MRTLRNLALVIAHLSLAGFVAILLYRQYQTREHDVAGLRRLAAEEHAETERLQREHATNRNVQDGLEHNDPYVVELLARDRMHLSRPGELAPPPLPAIDSTSASGTNVPSPHIPPGETSR